MARYKKKRARELQRDRFRDTTMDVFERLSNRFEGKGRPILYGVLAVVLLSAIVGFGLWWRNRKTDEARRALGRAISIATAPVSATAVANSAASGFTSEQERARKVVEEFQKVAAKYGDPYRTEARYFIATNLLYIEREKGLSELAELSKSDNGEVATLAKFALAQTKEADARFEEAAPLYSEVAGQNSVIVTPESAKLRLAIVYKKQGKSKEATELLFQIVETARQAKDKDGLPLPQSAAAREAAKELQKLDPDRYAQLTPESPAGFSF